MELWREEIQCEINRALLGVQKVRILDAGGGKKVQIKLPDTRHVTVIDIDRNALAVNRIADEKILGDIERYDFQDREFDLVICWDVLEHLHAPIATVQRLARTLSPYGLILLRGPLEASVKGVVARRTPFWVHVAFHRYFLGTKNAGRPGYPPFPLTETAIAGDAELVEALRSLGLNIVVTKRFEGNHAERLRRKAYPVYALYRVAGIIMSSFTGGRLGMKETDFFVIASR